MPNRPPSLPLGTGRGGALVRSPRGALVPSPRGALAAPARAAATGGLLGAAGRLLGNVGLALELPGVAQRAYEGAIGLRESVEGLLSGDIAGANRRTRMPGYQPVSSGRPAPSLSPAPGAPGRGGTYYGSPFANSREQNLNRINSDPRFGANPPAPAAAAPLRGGGGSRPAPARPTLPLGSGIAPGFGPTATGTTAAQNRASEQLRMEQQYSRPQYWNTDAGKGMLDLAANQRAPMESKLSDYYAAQRAVGIGAKEQIADAVSGGRADLKAWALANPDLAYREYLKRSPEGAAQLLREPQAFGASEAYGKGFAQPDEVPLATRFNPATAGLDLSGVGGSGRNVEMPRNVDAWSKGFDQGTDMALDQAYAPGAAQIRHPALGIANPAEEAPLSAELIGKGFAQPATPQAAAYGATAPTAAGLATAPQNIDAWAQGFDQASTAPVDQMYGATPEFTGPGGDILKRYLDQARRQQQMRAGMQ